MAKSLAITILCSSTNTSIARAGIDEIGGLACRRRL